MTLTDTVPRMLVSRSGLCPVMVGRDEELTQLRALLDAPGRAGTTAPTVVTISGEAGVGKSRLVRELLLAAPAGWAVIAGQAEEGDLARPFELLRDAVELEVGRWHDVPAALHERRHAVGHVLTGLLPAEHGDAPHDHPLDELLRAAVEVIRHVADGRRALVVFEDLHWADAESVALFGRLATRPDLDLVLVGTFRLEDVDRRHPLAGLLAELQRTRSVHAVELGRLTQRELGDMLRVVFGRNVSERAVDALHRRTQGNPFFVEELLDSSCCDDPEELATTPLPWNVAEAVLRRVDVLDDEARCVLDAAAVLGTRIPFDLLAAVSGVPEDRLIPALRTLIDGRMLVEGESDVFSFRHALVRDAVAGALLGREQRRLHERALEELRAMGSDDTAALARHAAGARRFDEVVELARAGADRYLREASPLHALNLAELGLAEAPDDLDLRRVAAWAAWSIGMAEEAARHAEEWRRLAMKSGEVEQESQALRVLAVASQLTGDGDRYWALIEQAVERAETLGPSRELAWALAFAAQAAMVLQLPFAEEWSRRAIDMIDEVGCDEIRPYALVNLGVLLAERADLEEEGLAMLDEARRLAEARNDGITVGRALNNTVSHFVFQRPPEESEPLLRATDDAIERYGIEAFRSKQHGHWVQFAAVVGDLPRAQRQLDLWRQREDDRVEVIAWMTIAGHVALETGDVTTAADLAAGVRALLEGLPVRAHVWSLALDLAVAADRGDDARPILDALADRLVENAGPGPSLGDIEGPAVLDALRAGVAPADVRAFFDRALPLSRRAHHACAGWAAHAEAALLEAEGDLAGAARAYRESLTSERPARWATWRAEAHTALARCLLALGQTDAALAEASQAVAVLERWPGHRRDRAAALVRRLSTAVEPGGAGGLTARELEVLALVAEGLTNRQIADRLYISVKTAAVHVSNILAKTGASSRTEAAAWAIQTGVLA